VKISTLRVDRILDALAEQAADRASLDGVGQPGHTRAGTCLALFDEARGGSQRCSTTEEGITVHPPLSMRAL
jgi:hypothetical protein